MADWNPARVRAADFGREYLVFGPSRSARRHDGPGAIEELAMNLVVLRLGPGPVAVEARKQEYYEVLTRCMVTRDVGPVAALVARLLAEQLPKQ